MSVDPNSPVPIYQQIAAYVRRAIAAGVYRPGEMIPSLRAMALELTVNPNTVQRAYEELEREGVIHARKGLGMFVAKTGVRSARSKSAAAVYSAFAQGVRAGQAANMSEEHIRATFEKASQDASVEARSKP
ncbi:MAG: GntR family transcriptional regulator [Phycisphaerae bacterium]|nr:GntR family transcriptional regulator [Phycisphaerae bacterium]